MDILSLIDEYGKQRQKIPLSRVGTILDYIKYHSWTNNIKIIGEGYGWIWVSIHSFYGGAIFLLFISLASNLEVLLAIIALRPSF